jgi:hypothetical protein
MRARAAYRSRMANASPEWKVLPHGPIVKLAENLWWVQGTLPKMSLKRAMTIAKMSDGRLVIHNAIALEEAAMKEIEAFGPPAFLIVPNQWHRLDAAPYKARYPELRVFAPTGSRPKIEQVVKVDGSYEEFPPDPQVRLERLRGLADAEGAMVVHSRDGATVVLNDVVFNMDRKRDPLGFLFTTLLGSAPGPRVSRLTKLALIKDKPAVRKELERYADMPELVRLIVAHEKVAQGPEAREALHAAMGYL